RATRPFSCGSQTSVHPRDRRSFPTRRSSDLDVRLGIYVFTEPTVVTDIATDGTKGIRVIDPDIADVGPGSSIDSAWALWVRNAEDRKSTRLNSSHVKISYAVFCLKKKTRTD